MKIDPGLLLKIRGLAKDEIEKFLETNPDPTIEEVRDYIMIEMTECLPFMVGSEDFDYDQGDLVHLKEWLDNMAKLAPILGFDFKSKSMIQVAAKSIEGVVKLLGKFYAEDHYDDLKVSPLQFIVIIEAAFSIKAADFPFVTEAVVNTAKILLRYDYSQLFVELVDTTKVCIDNDEICQLITLNIKRFILSNQSYSGMNQETFKRMMEICKLDAAEMKISVADFLVKFCNVNNSFLVSVAEMLFPSKKDDCPN